MGWMTELSALYDLVTNDLERNDKPLPLYHIENNAPLIITLNGEGMFQTARLLDEKSEKSDWPTCMPCTEKSAVRTSGAEAYPFCDKLEYVAGDYDTLEYVIDEYQDAHDDKKRKDKHEKLKDKHEKYLALLKEWAESKEYSNQKIKSVYKYVKEGTPVTDLLRVRLLQRGIDVDPNTGLEQLLEQELAFPQKGIVDAETGRKQLQQELEFLRERPVDAKTGPKQLQQELEFLPEAVVDAKTGRKQLQQELTSSQEGVVDAETRRKQLQELLKEINVFVKWEVEIPGDSHGQTWKDADIQKLWVQFYSNYLKRSNKAGFCYVSGKNVTIATLHPIKIRHAGDSARIISSNDNANYTFRGRFENAEQACQIGIEITTKAHSALRWLIAKQQNKPIGKGLTVVSWCSTLA
ncbi:MAG: type I-C CRISPR-associated protein Cas8c/Csd1, partial [Treponema sp.]|nr:type I-C CRISPR-associated protein Cas8c/Csd1 [Treponema sp.]